MGARDFKWVRKESIFYNTLIEKCVYTYIQVDTVILQEKRFWKIKGPKISFYGVNSEKKAL